MADTAPPPLSYERDPLSHPRASFNGHSSWRSPSQHDYEDGIAQAEGSKDAQVREAETVSREQAQSNGWDPVENGGELDWPTAEAVKLRESSSSHVDIYR